MRHKSGSPPRAYPNRVLRATRIPTAAALGNLRYRYVVPILPVVACLNSRADSANCNQFAQRKQSPNGLDLRATASEQQQQQTKTGEPYPRSMPAGRRSRISCSTQDASYSLKFLAGGATRRGATMVPCEMEQKVGAGVFGCLVLFDSWCVKAWAVELASIRSATCGYLYPKGLFAQQLDPRNSVQIFEGGSSLAARLTLRSFAVCSTPPLLPPFE